MGDVVHLDNAAAGRSSGATRRAVAAHLDREAELGAYVAEAEAEALLAAGREGIAHLLGMPADGVAFVESATAAIVALLDAMAVEPGDVVAVAPSEWGPNLAAFADAGLRIVELPVDGAGVIDLDAMPAMLATRRPAFVHVTQVASHRALVQPAGLIAGACRAADVPIWVDAAQALGHVDTAVGADVVYATSRKWLAGPRGVGMLAISERWWPSLRFRAPASDPAWFPGDRPPVRNLESGEANVAGRVGFASAVQQHLDAGALERHNLLRAVGRATRLALADVPGWRVVDAIDVPCAITAIAPTAGADVAATRARLLAEHRIVTTACQIFRAPREMTEPTLRISPNADLLPAELGTLARALAG
ncbi:MAG: aminotransferase class V-fold PLP-dependent enzyme [Ilumatobacteraceae bacterium]